MKIIKLLGVLGSVLMPVFAAQATELKVEWFEPESYVDIRGVNMNQKRYQEQLLNELSEQFKKSAERHIPEGRTLHLQVTNVDLAGRIDYFFNSPFPVRVVRRIDSPSINLSYEITDENNIVLVSGEERMKDTGFDRSNIDRHPNDPLHFEKKMINDWFRKTF